MRVACIGKVALVGGPDVDGRIDLMHRLKDSFNVFAIGSNPALSERFAQAGFRYHYYSLARRVNPLSDLFTLMQLLRIFRHEQPDIVHAFDTKPCVFARLAARLAGVPIVVGTLPGLGSLYVTSGIATRTVRVIYEMLQRLACHVSDFTVFQNHDDARHFVERGLAPAHKATMIPGSGVRTDVFSRQAVDKAEVKQLRVDLGLSHEDVVVTMISRLIRSKGVLEFAEAARIVKCHHDHVRFLLVGPDDRESVDRLGLDELKMLSESVTWLGERPNIPLILALSDIFVLPSFYREGVPRVLLEAASMGLPLIATKSPGCVEVVHDGVNGFLVPPCDSKALAKAIETLVQAPSLRHTLGLASRELAVTSFDLSVIAQETANLYCRLLSSKQGT